MSTLARVNVELPEELHRQAKAAAALAGVTLKEFLIAALQAAVEAQQRPRRGGPRPR